MAPRSSPARHQPSSWGDRDGGDRHSHRRPRGRRGQRDTGDLLSAHALKGVDRRGPSPWGAALCATEEAAIECRLCPRLVAYREEVGASPPPRHAGEPYWSAPVPGFGDPGARILILGLAPSAHGGNRTGRAFTGNRSADWLVASMYRTGLADRPDSVGRGDGLMLRGSWMTSAVRCAPPANKPTEAERATCARHLRATVKALPSLRVVVALGAFAWDAVFRGLAGDPPPVPFGHGVEAPGPEGLTFLACYHPSPNNTATGRLTGAMNDELLYRARAIADDAD